MNPAPGAVEDLLRELAPQVLAALVRRRGDFADAEDAVQEAPVGAALEWADRGCRTIRAAGCSPSPTAA